MIAEVKLDMRLSWSDGFYAGLVAGVVLSLFFMIVDVLTHQPLAHMYVFLASAILGRAALAGGGLPVALGVGLFFLMAAVGGVFYAGIARHVGALAQSPTSSLTGLVYGFLVWLLFVDLVVPLTGMQQTIDHPLWVSAAGIGIFYGSTLCEYLSGVARKRQSRSQPS